MNRNLASSMAIVLQPSLNMVGTSSPLKSARLHFLHRHTKQAAASKLLHECGNHVLYALEISDSACKSMKSEVSILG